MRLAVGTVQFGLDYGIANATGRTPADEAACILDQARLAGIDTLDTAAAYGDSEQVLGGIGVEGWKVVSKVPPVPDGVPNCRLWVREQIRQSLDRLRLDRLDGLLLHSATDLLKPQGAEIAQGLCEAKAEGWVSKVGYSIYAPQMLSELLPVMQPDLVQAPFNVLDQRLSRSGWLVRLTDAGIEVHARSVFLQGLLLMSPGQRPASFDRWSALWQTWDALVAGHRGGALSLCLGFAKAQVALSRIVVGVEHRHHLQQLLAAWAEAESIDAQALSCDDPQLLEPFNWVAK